MSAYDPAAATGHERRDVRPGTIVAWVAGVFALMIFSAGAMWLLLGGINRYLARTSPPASPLASEAPTEPPEPRLQVDPWGDIAKLRATEQAQLDGYGWVDRQAGTVHIPIDRAMSLFIERRAETAP